MAQNTKQQAALDKIAASSEDAAKTQKDVAIQQFIKSGEEKIARARAAGKGNKANLSQQEASAMGIHSEYGTGSILSIVGAPEDFISRQKDSNVELTLK
jgi:hypothetical protein